ncbi:MAG: flavodoxin family protein [Clostridiales Family XIII bacterium]|jgi:multimeric flavodoxin WrbA|nr:flavodoxin family protein [Clostridiales Family XIII bacterium]
MKVLLLNGSPHKEGCTYIALSEVAGAIEKEGIETEIFWIGNEPVKGCISCGACKKEKGRCTFDGDAVNVFLEKSESADGFVFGSPVHYAAPAGAVLTLLDRVFYAGAAFFAGKPGAAVVSARRAGTTASLDVLQKYFPIGGMPQVPTQYWPQVHGAFPEDVKQDLEGLQIMRTLGRNFAWLLKCIEAGKEKGISYPEAEVPRAWTNFVR